MWLSACTALGVAPTPTTVPPTEVPSPVPATATPVVEPTAVPLTPTPLPLANPLHIQVIRSDTNDPAPLVALIERNAAMLGIPVLVSVRSPDGVYGVVQAGIQTESVDAWIGSEYDLQQLQFLNAVQPGQPGTLPANHVPLFTEAVQYHATYAVTALAARNYLVAVYNTELMDQAPTTTAELMNLGAYVQGRISYRMAFSWPEGRWFAVLLDSMGATQTLTSSASLLDEESAVVALQSLTDLRTLGPRDATTYADATTDMIWWRAPYSWDGDAAIRRYEVYSDTMTMAVEPLPLYTASGQALRAPVDVVYAIPSVTARPEYAGDLQKLLTQLQSPLVQADLVRTMRWIPVNLDAQNSLQDDAVWPALAAIQGSLTAQHYDAVTICRWDVYESILPFVLLRDMSVRAGVEAINQKLTQCAEAR